MKKYFKLFAALLAIVMVLGIFAACGKKDEQPTDKQDDPTPAGHTHVWDEGKVTKEATCTEEGEKTFACSGCNETKIEKIAALGHTWNEGEVTKDATCSAEGEKTRTCTVCGATETEAVAKLAHTWDEGKVTKEATTEAEGEKEFTCTVCGEKKTEKIDKLQPAEEDPETPATPTDGEMVYEENEDGTYTFCYYEGEDTEVTVPATYNGKAVTVLSMHAFIADVAPNVTKVNLKEGLKVIEEKAFEGCVGLAEITIPDSVEEIGEKAFFNCKALQVVKLGKGTVEIPANAFAGCTNITVLDLGDGLEKLPANTFQDAKDTLVKVTIGENLEQINNGFEDTTKLRVVINKSAGPEDLNDTGRVHDILHKIEAADDANVTVEIFEKDGYLFYRSADFTDMDHILEGPIQLVAYIGPGQKADSDAEDEEINPVEKYLKLPADADDNKYEIADNAFTGRTDIKTVVISKNVTKIGKEAFKGCYAAAVGTTPAKGLTTVIFAEGSKVTSIGKDAFAGCTLLTYTTYNNAKYLGIDDGNAHFVLVSATATDITSCIIHADTKVIADSAFEDCDALDPFTFDGTIAAWGNVKKGTDWHKNAPATGVTCSDGVDSF